MYHSVLQNTVDLFSTVKIYPAVPLTLNIIYICLSYSPFSFSLIRYYVLWTSFSCSPYFYNKVNYFPVSLPSSIIWVYLNCFNFCIEAINDYFLVLLDPKPNDHVLKGFLVRIACVHYSALPLLKMSAWRINLFQWQ